MNDIRNLVLITSGSILVYLAYYELKVLLNNYRDRQATCHHEWSTHIKDCSGNGGYDDFIETVSGRIDGQFFHQCELCQLKENRQFVQVSLENIGYGDKVMVGRLDLKDFSDKLIALHKRADI